MSYNLVLLNLLAVCLYKLGGVFIFVDLDVPLNKGDFVEIIFFFRFWGSDLCLCSTAR